MKSIFLWIENYLNKARRIFVAVITTLVLLVLTFSILGGVAGSFAGDDEVDTKNKILYLEMSGVIVDQPQSGPSDPVSIILAGDTQPNVYAIRDVLKVLDAVADDTNLKAVYLDVDNLSMGGQVFSLAIADAIKNIVDNDIRVISYTNGLLTSDYLVASQATELYLNTSSYYGIETSGFSRKREYMQDFYNNIKLDYEIFSAGDFKSGPEPYTRMNMSENDKIAWNAFANPLWNTYKQKMESGRDLEAGTIQSYGDNFDILAKDEKGDMNKVALNLGLVDGLMKHEEIRDYMIAEFGSEDADKDKWPEGVSYAEYLSTLDASFDEDAEDIIAIINVEGVIMTGQESQGTAGSDSIVEKIYKAKNDKNVKVLILRVNSGGGDVYASELILNALDDFKSTGRKVYTSMGNVAASGGVWITTNSSEIWAEPNTVTGSIGVYSIVPTLGRALDWAGINVDGVSSTKMGEWEPTEPMPDYMKDLYQANVDGIYENFVSVVANNRSMEYEDVLKIAGGRIWAGDKAQELGLVDKLGTLNDVIAHVAETHALDNYKIKYYKRDLEPWEVFFEISKNVNIKLPFSSSRQLLLKELNAFDQLIKQNGKFTPIAYCSECELVE
jgi:protease-4|tara:strand:- start:27582 stop:29420 length:1839 start_codon:yes stop_codon:yes gene_type:complete